ncbi:hypothetical protein EXN66_Car002964 [Channa argus]|uniref:Uncharacterized protein n=1 Tax=Channa argus TaxID=215402 RepID=A0A6G1PAM8_CHAAH|nr:hypothetical protein EXN66_Car002964 [Channa argus]
MLICICSVDPAVHQYSALISLLEQDGSRRRRRRREGRVNENGMDPVETSPSPWGLVEQHSP